MNNLLSVACPNCKGENLSGTVTLVWDKPKQDWVCVDGAPEGKLFCSDCEIDVWGGIS